MKPTKGTNIVLPFALVSLLFMLWGMANNMNDTLLAAFKRIMSMSDFETSLVQGAFYGSYFCFALPAALFIRKYSYKSGILLGLFLYAAGTMLFLPAGEAASYPAFLFAIYVMAGGCAILETTANPYIISMGPEETSTRRLNIAQAFNPLGAIAGILVSRHFILARLNEADASARAGMDGDSLRALQQDELNAVSETYMMIGVVLLVLMAVIFFTRMPADRDTSGRWNFGNTLRRLWKNRRYRYGVIAQFFYVGAQTCVWSFTIRLAMHRLGILEKEASMMFLYSILAFTAFRFLFTWLMKYIKPVYLLAGASVLAVITSAGVLLPDPYLAVTALISVSAAMSLMFPTIYGIALDGIHGDDTKIAASGLIMAILGGAVITPLQAAVSDRAGITFSFIVPMMCFIVILLYSAFIIYDHKSDRK